MPIIERRCSEITLSGDLDDLLVVANIPVWVSKDGTETPICWMSDEHLQNALRAYVRTQDPNPHVLSPDELQGAIDMNTLVGEINRRKELVR